METIQFFDERFYKRYKGNEELYYPSVTTKLGILSRPFLYKWYGELGWEQARKKLKESQDFGTNVHYGFHILCKGGEVHYNDPRHPSLNLDEIKKLSEKSPYLFICESQEEMVDIWKLQRFLTLLKPKILMTEESVYSDTYQEAGTIDALFEIEAGKYLINGAHPIIIEKGIYVFDAKTGNSFDDKGYLQTACYAKMIKEEMGIHVQGTLIGHTSSKNRKGIEGFGIYLRTGIEIEADYSYYRKASDLWLRDNSDLKPKNFDFPAMLKLGEII